MHMRPTGTVPWVSACASTLRAVGQPRWGPRFRLSSTFSTVLRVSAQAWAPRSALASCPLTALSACYHFLTSSLGCCGPSCLACLPQRRACFPTAGVSSCAPPCLGGCQRLQGAAHSDPRTNGCRSGAMRGVTPSGSEVNSCSSCNRREVRLASVLRPLWAVSWFRWDHT